MMISRKKETLEDYKDEILAHLENIDTLPYSHNLISINLRAVAEKFGHKKANGIIDELGLDQFGYKKVIKR